MDTAAKRAAVFVIVSVLMIATAGRAQLPHRADFRSGSHRLREALIDDVTGRRAPLPPDPNLRLIDHRSRKPLALIQDPAAAPAERAPAPAEGTPAPAENPSHVELRQLRTEVVDAINKQDLDRLLEFLDEDVVVTWQNAEVSRKPAGVRQYYERMMHGPDRVVASVAIDPEVDELTHLYGNTGFAFGHSNDHFRLTDGRDFVVQTRWSATVVKKDGKWLVAGVHLSSNMFDNPILRIAIRETLKWTALVAVPVGLVLGVLLGSWWSRRRKTS